MQLIRPWLGSTEASVTDKTRRQFSTAAAVHPAAWCGLRRGGLLGQRRDGVDLEAAWWLHGDPGRTARLLVQR